MARKKKDNDNSGGEPRSYSGWRRRRGFSLARLGPKDLILAVIGFFVAMVVLNISPLFGVLMLLALGLWLVLAVIPFGHSTIVERITFATRGRKSLRDKTAPLFGGVLAVHPRRDQLPGVAAPLVPVEVTDGLGGRQALIHNRATGMITAMLRVAPVGITMSDQGDTDRWVANYGGWMASLGYMPAVRAVAITVDTAPTGGQTQAEYVRERMNTNGKGAPEFAKAVMEELIAPGALSAADVNAMVSINYDPMRMTPKPDTLEAAAAEVVRSMATHEAALGSSGAPVIERVRLPWLLRHVRMAFDPASRGEAMRQLQVGAGEEELMSWRDAGPIRTEPTWTEYKHDSGLSVSWVLDALPGQRVLASILIPLMTRGRFARRISIVYHPLSAVKAAKEVESEINSANIRGFFSQKTKKDETERDREDARRARQAAYEEATGAGVGTWTLYITTTVTDPSQLPDAISETETRAAQSKLLLRRCDGAQAAAFVTSLGLGVDPIEALERGEIERWEAA